MDVEQEFQTIQENFSKNLESVKDLLQFDQTVLRVCISHLEELEEYFDKKGITNPHLRVTKTIKAIKNIKENDSLKIKYRTIANQCLVLSVSHFASAIHDLFKTSINYAFQNKLSDKLKKEEFKFSVQELVDLGSNIDDKIGELIAENNSISFQDMKSISRAFQNYFGYEISKTKDVDNIIFGQACRHSIVHSGAKVDNKLLNQIRAAKQNELDVDLQEGQILSFKNDHLTIILESMEKYLDNLINGLLIKWNLKDV